MTRTGKGSSPWRLMWCLGVGSLGTIRVGGLLHFGAVLTAHAGDTSSLLLDGDRTRRVRLDGAHHHHSSWRCHPPDKEPTTREVGEHRPADIIHILELCKKFTAHQRRKNPRNASQDQWSVVAVLSPVAKLWMKPSKIQRTHEEPLDRTFCSVLIWLLPLPMSTRTQETDQKATKAFIGANQEIPPKP